MISGRTQEKTPSLRLHLFVAYFPFSLALIVGNGKFTSQRLGKGFLTETITGNTKTIIEGIVSFTIHAVLKERR
jgi:hypothetical protein